MDKELKLYRVTLIGMLSSEGISYVVASDPTEAYDKVRTRLDKKDIGFRNYRELNKIELIASSYEYSNLETLLYL